MLFVTQRLADFDQALHERVVGHGNVPPHRLEELLLRHEAAGIADEVGQYLDRPLAQGYLTGKFKAGMPSEATRLGNNKMIHQFDDEHGRNTLAAVDDIAAARGVSASQVAMNWVRRKPGVATILIGARNETQLLDNLAAAQWSLSDDEMTRLEEASAKPLQYP